MFIIKKKKKKENLDVIFQIYKSNKHPFPRGGWTEENKKWRSTSETSNCAGESAEERRRLKRMYVTDDCYRGVRLIVSFSLFLSFFLSFFNTLKLCIRSIKDWARLPRVTWWNVQPRGRWPARCFNNVDFLGRHARRTPWIPCVWHMTVGNTFLYASYVGHTRHAWTYMM